MGSGYNIFNAQQKSFTDEFTLIRCVNARLYKASINTCTKCEVMSEDSEDLAFLNHVISRDQNISCNHSPLPRPGCD